MAEPEHTSPPDRFGGDRRAKDRRRSDRRQDSRRAPLPPWRRPWAYLAYGAVGALLLVLLLRAMGEDEEAVLAIQASPSEQGAAAADEAPLPVMPATREAYTVAQYERLMAEGEDAEGVVVETELYCGSITPIAMRQMDSVDPTLAVLADDEGRVGGAECRWSRDSRTSDFLLVVPPQLAEQFARAPEVELNFVRLRQVPANVEWLGRSEALSLRTAGVLRQIRSAAP